MKSLIIDIGILIGCGIIAASTLNACSTPAIASTTAIKTNDLIVLNNATSSIHGGYASPVHPHGELALVGYNLQGTQSAPIAVFLCVLSMRSHISMAKLEGDALARAGNLVDQSTNPFQLCHPHLVVNGRASYLQGAHNHA